MLPDCRKEGDIFSIPKFTVERKDVGSFMEELRGFHGEFRDCFLRKETKENFFRYMVGQFSELERKSIEPITLSVENSTVRSMQRAVSDAVWDEDKMIGRYHGLVGEDLGDSQGVLIFDETGFQKKGAGFGRCSEAVLWKLGQGGELSGRGFCGVCLSAWLCLFGQARIIYKKWRSREVLPEEDS